MTHTPLQDECQVDILNRFDRPRRVKPILVCILSRLQTRGPNPSRTEHILPLQVKMPVVRTWSVEKLIYKLHHFVCTP